MIARRRAGAAIVLGALAACADGAGPSDAPRLVSAQVSVNARNALSLLVAVASARADSARVLYRAAAGGPADATPFTSLRGTADTLLVLGLAPTTGYRLVVELAGPGGTTRSDSLAGTTAAVPAGLDDVYLDTTGTSTNRGYLVTSVVNSPASYLVAFDYAGTVRWYRQFDEITSGGADVQQLSNGNLVMYLGLSTGSQATYGRFVEIAPDGRAVRSFAAPPPYYTDDHDILVSGSGVAERVYLFGYDHRNLDLSSIGGGSNVVTAGHTLLRMTAAGAVELFWKSWDHLAVSDWIEPTGLTPTTTNTDFDHPNAVALDLDGGVLVSWRNMGEVSKHDPVNGEYVWRMGGTHNQFTFVGDPFGGFSGQHCVRVLANGNLLLFDNGLRHVPLESRAVEYRLDVAAKTATMVWQYRHTPAIRAGTRGSVARLGNGHTIVGFGAVPTVVEADSAGNTVWQATLMKNGAAEPFYRMMPVASLYRHEVP